MFAFGFICGVTACAIGLAIYRSLRDFPTPPWIPRDPGSPPAYRGIEPTEPWPRQRFREIDPIPERVPLAGTLKPTFPPNVDVRDYGKKPRHA